LKLIAIIALLAVDRGYQAASIPQRGVNENLRQNPSNSGAESWTGIGVVAGLGAVVLIVQSPHGRNGEVRWRSELLQIL
jgi:hypothetical protein